MFNTMSNRLFCHLTVMPHAMAVTDWPVITVGFGFEKPENCSQNGSKNPPHAAHFFGQKYTVWGGACLGNYLGHVWDNFWGILLTMDNNPRCYIYLWCRFSPDDKVSDPGGSWAAISKILQRVQNITSNCSADVETFWSYDKGWNYQWCLMSWIDSSN